MKKTISGAGDPQPRLGVQETFLHIRESPAPRGMAWQPLPHDIPPFTLIDKEMHDVCPRRTRTVAALRKKGKCLATLTLLLTFTMLIPSTSSPLGKNDKFPQHYEFQNSMSILGKNLALTIAKHLPINLPCFLTTSRHLHTTNSHPHFFAHFKPTIPPPNPHQKIQTDPLGLRNNTHPKFFSIVQLIGNHSNGVKSHQLSTSTEISFLTSASVLQQLHPTVYTLPAHFTKPTPSSTTNTLIGKCAIPHHTERSGS